MAYLSVYCWFSVVEVAIVLSWKLHTCKAIPFPDRSKAYVIYIVMSAFQRRTTFINLVIEKPPPNHMINIVDTNGSVMWTQQHTFQRKYNFVWCIETFNSKRMKISWLSDAVLISYSIHLHKEGWLTCCIDSFQWIISCKLNSTNHIQHFHLKLTSYSSFTHCFPWLVDKYWNQPNNQTSFSMVR